MAWYVTQAGSGRPLTAPNYPPHSNTNQKGKPDVEMPADVVEKTKARYTEVFERLTDNSLEDALKKLAN